MLYFSRISLKKYRLWMRMYSGSGKGLCRKWSLRSALRKRAPCFESDMILLISNFVSSIEAAGDAASPK